jgi:hypothetical protein
MDLREIGWEDVDWIHLAEDSDMLVVGSCERDNKHLSSINSWEFPDLVTISFSRTLPHGVDQLVGQTDGQMDR